MEYLKKDRREPGREDLMRTSATTLLLILMMSVSTLAQKDEIKLTCGVYQSDKASVMYAKFRPFLKHLDKQVAEILDQPVSIKLKICKTYDDALNDLVEGEVDFVRFGPASYILARERNPDIKLLAMEEKKGKVTFKGVIAVRTDSPIKTMKDLKGKSFAFGDPNSTIGRYLAQDELLKAGLNAKSLSGHDFLDRHDRVFSAVEAGRFDAGALKISTFKKMNKSGKLRILKDFENKTKPWVARAGLETRVFRALGQALRQTKDAAILKQFKVSAFTKSHPRVYQTIAEAMERAKAFK